VVAAVGGYVKTIRLIPDGGLEIASARGTKAGNRGHLAHCVFDSLAREKAIPAKSNVYGIFVDEPIVSHHVIDDVIADLDP
jgi:hypothetical protein